MKLSLLVLLTISAGNTILPAIEAQALLPDDASGEPIEDLAVYFVNNTPVINVERRRIFALFEINRLDIDFTITCSISSSALRIREDCSSGRFELRDILPGIYTLRLVARDSTTNERAITRIRLVLHQDNSFCGVVFQNRGVTVNKTSATFEFMGTGASSRFQCILDETEFVECSSPYTIAIDNVAAGNHRLKIVPQGSCERKNRPTILNFQIE